MYNGERLWVGRGLCPALGSTPRRSTGPYPRMGWGLVFFGVEEYAIVAYGYVVGKFGQIFKVVGVVVGNGF